MQKKKTVFHCLTKYFCPNLDGSTNGWSPIKKNARRATSCLRVLGALISYPRGACSDDSWILVCLSVGVWWFLGLLSFNSSCFEAYLCCLLVWYATCVSWRTQRYWAWRLSLIEIKNHAHNSQALPKCMINKPQVECAMCSVDKATCDRKKKKLSLKAQSQLAPPCNAKWTLIEWTIVDSTIVEASCAGGVFLFCNCYWTVPRIVLSTIIAFMNAVCIYERDAAKPHPTIATDSIHRRRRTTGRYQWPTDIVVCCSVGRRSSPISRTPAGTLQTDKVTAQWDWYHRQNTDDVPNKT